MARPYSLDLRVRVAGVVAAGETRRGAAARFGVSASAAIEWMQRIASKGSARPKPMDGRRPFAPAGHRDLVPALVAAKPDLTLRALVAELADAGVKVSGYAVWHLLKHKGISFEKMPARGRAGPARNSLPW